MRQPGDSPVRLQLDAPQKTLMCFECKIQYTWQKRYRRQKVSFKDCFSYEYIYTHAYTNRVDSSGGNAEHELRGDLPATLTGSRASYSHIYTCIYMTHIHARHTNRVDMSEVDVDHESCCDLSSTLTGSLGSLLVVDTFAQVLSSRSYTLVSCVAPFIL